MIYRLKQICSQYRNPTSIIRKKENSDLYQFIIDSTPMLSGNYQITNRVYWILNDIHDFPRCQLQSCNCRLDNNKHFIDLSHGYRKYCCRQHVMLDNIAKQKSYDSFFHRFIQQEGQLPQFKTNTDELKYLVFKYHKYLSKILHSSEKRYLYDYIQRYDEKIKDYNINTKIYWIINNIHDFPKCKKCGRPLLRQINKLKQGYGDGYCSINCANSSLEIKSKKQETNKLHCGQCWPLMAKKNQDKAKITKKHRYGYENYNNRKSAEKTNLLRYGGLMWSSNHELRIKKQCVYKYKNYNVKSSWELYKIIYHEDHNDTFTYQPNIQFKYEYDGKIYTYEPDFKVNGVIQEVKGNHFFENKDINGKMICPYKISPNSNHTKEWIDGKYEAKHQCMINNCVVILTQKDICKYIEHVNNHYGNDYIKRFKINVSK